MGVRRSDWVVIGANIGTEHHNEEWYEMDESPLDKYDRNYKTGEITYLYDGMSGEYFIVGVVVKADTDGYDGLGLNEISTGESFEIECERVWQHIKDNFGIEVEPKLIVLTHWT